LPIRAYRPRQYQRKISFQITRVRGRLATPDQSGRACDLTRVRPIIALKSRRRWRPRAKQRADPRPSSARRVVVEEIGKEEGALEIGFAWGNGRDSAQWARHRKPPSGLRRNRPLAIVVDRFSKMHQPESRSDSVTRDPTEAKSDQISGTCKVLLSFLSQFISNSTLFFLARRLGRMRK